MHKECINNQVLLCKRFMFQNISASVQPISRFLPMKPVLASLAPVAALAIAACSTPAPRTAPDPIAAVSLPERAVRRDLPMPPAMRRRTRLVRVTRVEYRGSATSSRRVDYKIDAKLDPATNLITGRETISLHNTTPDTLKTVVLRLYQNYFMPRVERND